MVQQSKFLKEAKPKPWKNLSGCKQRAKNAIFRRAREFLGKLIMQGCFTGVQVEK